MKANWLIELGLFEDTELDLIKAIENSGREYKTLSKDTLLDNSLNDYLRKFGKDECVVFYGSMNFGRKLRKLPWVPGVYFDEEKYKCTSYYPAFGNLLLHNNYLMMPYGDLLRRKRYLYELFGENLFIRPNSGSKEFTGMVVPEKNFEDCVKLAGFYNVEPELLVVVSQAETILKEWRFVVVNQEVISGSLYRDWSSPEELSEETTTSDYVLLNSHSVKKLCTDHRAWDFANKCAKLYNPEPCWTMDIAETYFRDYSLLEIGCFSCAGMYGNGLNIIVEKVSEEAEREWKEYFTEDVIKPAL